MKLARRVSLGSYLKEQKRIQKLAEKANEAERIAAAKLRAEAKLQELCRTTAKSMLGGIGKYTLKVNNADTYVSSSKKMMSLGFKDSIWASWSPLAR